MGMVNRYYINLLYSPLIFVMDLTDKSKKWQDKILKVSYVLVW